MSETCEPLEMGDTHDTDLDDDLDPESETESDDGQPPLGGEAGTVVWQMGLSPPVEGRATVQQQMRLQHEYRVVLTLMERWRRREQREAILRFPAVREMTAIVQEADAAIEQHVASMKAARAKARRRSGPGTPGADERATLKRLRQARAVARAILAFRRREVMVENARERDRINDMVEGDPVPGTDPVRREGGFKKFLRHQSGLRFGTYQLVEQATEASAKSLRKKPWAKADPKVPRWRGDGFVSEQITAGGLPVENLGTTGTLVRLVPGPCPEARPPAERARNPFCLISPPAGSRAERIARHRARNAEEHRKSKRADAQQLYLWLRVGSDARRGPVWAKWPIVVHRPLPSGSVIQRVTVALRHRGPRAEWWCCMTLSGVVRPRAVVPVHEAVAVDLGWRLMPDGGIRVGMWRGTDGESGEIRVPPACARAVRACERAGRPVLSDAEKVESLASIRDKNLDVIRGKIAALAAASPNEKWLKVATETLAKWRAPRRFVNLLRAWRENRFAGDEDTVRALEIWRYDDQHLWSWQESARVKGLRRRRELYRVAARELAGRYDRLVLERFDLREVAQKPEVESEEGENQSARHQRQEASPSELRAVLCNAFRRPQSTKRAPWPDDVEAALTTQTCNVCQYVASFDTAASVVRATPCPKCGSRWDQDLNAADNMLVMWRRQCERQRADQVACAARAGNKAPGRKEKSKGKSSNRFTCAREKAARYATARKPDPKAAE